MPRIPKPPELLQRRNRSTTAATLPSEAESQHRAVPPLPVREKATEVWHPRVVDWWETLWRSPMAGEYLTSDLKGGLYLLAELYQRRWSDPDTKTLIALATAIGHLEVRFGCSPIDRRRLQWEIKKGEVAEERTKTRRRSRALDASSKKDPREVLRVV